MAPPTPADLYRRLAGRSAHELFFRARQELYKRSDLLRYRFGLQRPVRDRGSGTLAKFFFEPDELPRIVAISRHTFGEQADGIRARAERICAHSFDLLGYRGLSFGEPIDWHVDPVNGRRSPLRPWYRIPFLDFEAVGDHKVIWELSRHQQLVTLAKAYLLSGEERFAEELARQWRGWLSGNPHPIGINWASALEVAFRAFSWIWVDHLMRGADALPPGFLAELRGELGRHARFIHRYLSTYFAPNTHLLGEGMALFFIGTLYPSLAGAARWRDAGWEIVLRESRRQVRADGLYFEQSIYYHVYALDFLLHTYLLAERNGVRGADELRGTIERMIEALVRLSPSGVAPRMGDDDGGRLFDPSRNRSRHMLDPVATGAVLFDRPDWLAVSPEPVEETLWLLGPDRFEQRSAPPGRRPDAASRTLPDSGLYVLGGRRKGGWRLVVDGGPQGTGRCGHGHADALSAQLASDAGDWLIDVGTGSYMRPEERDLFRGTAAHNTLVAAGQDQAVPTEPFAWQAIPNVRVERWQSHEHVDYFRARHDGYRRLQAPLIHRRTVVAVENLWLVRDVAEGEGALDLMVSWHCAPRLRVSMADRHRVELADPDNAGGVHVPLAVAFTGADEWQGTIEEAPFSPAYGATGATSVVRLRRRGALPAEVATLLVAAEGATLSRSSVDNAVAYRIDTGSRCYLVVFGSGAWCVDEHAGSAELAVFRGLDGTTPELVGSYPGPA